MDVFVEPCATYSPETVHEALARLRPIFAASISPGNVVVLKPNWLADRHKYVPEEWQSVITHPAVIGAVLDLVLECLRGRGRVVIADGPQTDSSWDRIMQRMQPEQWFEKGRRSGVPVSVLDLRDHEWETRGDVTVGRRRLAGDPLGSTVCDLAAASEFHGHARSRFGYYGADYDKAETNRVHGGGQHLYKVSRTVTAADVFINLPKMKTHKKAGITCSLKNLVGVNTYKNWLPHHSEGTPDEGGDQFPRRSAKNRLERIATERFKALLTSWPRAGRAMIPLKALGKRTFGETRNTARSGNWYGNDTLWRTILDLNKVLLYADPDGTLRAPAASARKRYISVVDGIVAGEGNGPEAPDPKVCGVLIAGTNAVAVDSVCAQLMGFDWLAIPSIRHAYGVTAYPLCDFSRDEIAVVSSDPRWNRPLVAFRAEDCFHFRPHFGWTGHVELKSTHAAALA